MVLYTFTIVNIKKRPTLSTALHIVRTLVLSLWIMPFSAAYLLQQGSRNKTYVRYSDKIKMGYPRHGTVFERALVRGP